MINNKRIVYSTVTDDVTNEDHYTATSRLFDETWESADDLIQPEFDDIIDFYRQMKQQYKD